MTTGQRLERDLPLILDELAVSPYPDYIDSVLMTTARRRQRPTWTFRERWIPMTTLTSRAATAPRTPLRAAAILALLLVALAVGAALLIGSRSQVPQPFGRAANGDVAYAASGDIFTVDPVSGVSTAIVTGPRDGPQSPLVARRDHARVRAEDRRRHGRGLPVRRPSRRISPGPAEDAGRHRRHRELYVLARRQGDPDHLRSGRRPAAPDRGDRRERLPGLDTNGPAAWADWRPPDGSEILFMGVDSDGANGCCAIQAVNAKTADMRTILGLEPGRFRGHGHMVAGRVPDLVRGVGRRGPGQRRLDRPDPHHRGRRVRRTHPSPGQPGTKWQVARELVERRHATARHPRRCAPTTRARGRWPSRSMAAAPASRSIGPAQ